MKKQQQPKRNTIRLTIAACDNADVVPGSPNDKARTVYTPLEGSLWNFAMATFYTALAELPGDIKGRVRAAIELGLDVVLRRIAPSQRKKLEEAMRAKLDELCPADNIPAPTE